MALNLIRRIDSDLEVERISRLLGLPLPLPAGHTRTKLEMLPDLAPRLRPCPICQCLCDFLWLLSNGEDVQEVVQACGRMHAKRWIERKR